MTQELKLDMDAIQYEYASLYGNIHNLIKADNKPDRDFTIKIAAIIAEDIINGREIQQQAINRILTFLYSTLGKNAGNQDFVIVYRDSGYNFFSQAEKDWFDYALDAMIQYYTYVNDNFKADAFTIAFRDFNALKKQTDVIAFRNKK